MTPRERMVATMNFQPVEGGVPHLELEFQLSQEVFGEPHLGWDYNDLPESQRKDALVKNVHHWAKVADAFDYCVITGIHWMPIEAQVQTYPLFHELYGDKYMLSGFVDGTLGIPDGDGFAKLAYRIADDEEALLAELNDHCERAIGNIKTLVGAGAEIIFMCSDYCFNQGPFLSPRQFRKYVTPFLKRQIDAIRDVGAYAVKHTDGNLGPIFDQLIEANPHALHSIDPMAGMDIKQVRERVGKNVVLMGNVDCSKLQSGTREEIETSARYCLEHGPIDGTGYVYCSSNCIFQGVPMDSYRCMLDVRDRWENRKTR